MYKDITQIKNTILKGDCATELQKIPDNSIDLIFADPPYFMQTDGVLLRTEGTKFAGVGDSWDKFRDYKHYDSFCDVWLKECKRILKEDGTIWVIGAFQNIYRIGYLMQNLGFWILNDVVWSKPNPVPNFKGTRFTNASETMLWCSKSKSARYTFNYKTMKYLNGGKQMRSVWDIGICIGNERMKNEDGTKAHSTQKPEMLLKNVILSSSKFGDTVLDPFFGSGTTGAVAKKLGRKFIGIERDEKYIELATERINGIIYDKENDLFYKNKLDEKPPSVSFKQMIAKGFFTENEPFYCPNQKMGGILKKNGHLDTGEKVLSIHKLSARLLGKANHNGWDYWSVKRKQHFLPIDEIRKEYRKMILGYEPAEL